MHGVLPNAVTTGRRDGAGRGGALAASELVHGGWRAPCTTGCRGGAGDGGALAVSELVHGVLASAITSGSAAAPALAVPGGERIGAWGSGERRSRTGCRGGAGDGGVLAVSELVHGVLASAITTGCRGMAGVGGGLACTVQYRCMGFWPACDGEAPWRQAAVRRAASKA